MHDLFTLLYLPLSLHVLLAWSDSTNFSPEFETFVPHSLTETSISSRGRLWVALEIETLQLHLLLESSTRQHVFWVHYPDTQILRTLGTLFNIHRHASDRVYRQRQDQFQFGRVRPH